MRCMNLRSVPRLKKMGVETLRWSMTFTESISTVTSICPLESPKLAYGNMWWTTNCKCEDLMIPVIPHTKERLKLKNKPTCSSRISYTAEFMYWNGKAKCKCCMSYFWLWTELASPSQSNQWYFLPTVCQLWVHGVHDCCMYLRRLAKLFKQQSKVHHVLVRETVLKDWLKKSCPSFLTAFGS